MDTCEAYVNGARCTNDVEWHVVIYCNHETVHGGDPLTTFAQCADHARAQVQGVMSTMFDADTVTAYPLYPSGVG